MPRPVFMRFTFLLFVLVLLAKSKEFLEAFNGALKISLLLVDETDFLVAFGFFVNVTSLLRDINALIVELQTHFILAFVLILLRNLLVDAD